MMRTYQVLIGFMLVGVMVRIIYSSWGIVLPGNSAHTLNDKELTGLYKEVDISGKWDGREIVSSKVEHVKQNILGIKETGEKRIEVDLTNQKLFAYEEGNIIYEYEISSGLNDWTPRGTFYVWIKLAYSDMRGSDYYLPNVPYVMYFANNRIPRWRGFGIHGTYWHNDFGRPKSHGCINLKTADAKELFEWANPVNSNPWSTLVSKDNPGTRIVIYGKYRGI